MLLQVNYRQPPTTLYGKKIKEPFYYTSHSNVDRVKVHLNVALSLLAKLITKLPLYNSAVSLMLHRYIGVLGTKILMRGACNFTGDIVESTKRPQSLNLR